MRKETMHHTLDTHSTKNGTPASRRAREVGGAWGGGAAEISRRLQHLKDEERHTVIVVIVSVIVIVITTINFVVTLTINAHRQQTTLPPE